MTQRGLTLIELIVALALFAVIGTLCWRASAQMIDTRSSIGDALQRWRDIGRAVARIEDELLSVAPGTVTVFDDTAGANRRLVAFPTLGVEAGIARSALRFADGRLDWLYWADGNASRAPEVIVLLDGVARFDWRYLADDGWRPDWPPQGGGGAALPSAVAIELELDDVGTISRVFALH
jgi:general secretion pathway protein J